MSGDFWTHVERNPTQATAAAMATAAAGSWASLPQSQAIRQLRALLVATLALTHPITPDPAAPGGYLVVSLKGSMLTPEENFRASMLCRTPFALTPSSGTWQGHTFTTTEGEEYTAPPQGEAASPILLALARVAIVTVVSAAAAYVAEVAGTVIDNELERQEDTRKLVASHSTALDAVAKHLEQEAKAGKTIPMSDPLKLLLTQLGDQQEQLAAKRGRPIPAPYEGAIDRLSQAGETISKNVSDSLPWIGAAAVVGGIFLFGSRR